MKCKRSDLLFIKIKCDDLKQAEALISGAFVFQKTGIIFMVEEFRTTPSSNSVLRAKVFGTRHQIVPKNQNVLCVVKLISKETVQTRKKEIQNVKIVEDLMSPTTKAVLLTRIKPLGNM